MRKKIVFNKPFISGNEYKYIHQAVSSGKLSGNGFFTKLCHEYIEERFNFVKVFLTTSCTDALEMAALLSGISPGDEVIIPSFTFVSTALAFTRQGANVVFWDSRHDHPGADEELLDSLVTSKTKAIVPVHYAGVSCDMDAIMAISKKYNLVVIEDAAQAIDSYYLGRPVGGVGHLGAYSFHDTKNIISGEGGLLIVNQEEYVKRAEIIWEKGTDRSKFFRGEVDKYSWVDTGSSFLASEITAAFLLAQLENIERIQKQRIHIWEMYYTGLYELEEEGLLKLPQIPAYSTNNAHMFYVICRTEQERDDLIGELKREGILAVFHYSSLHASKYGKQFLKGTETIKYSNIYSTRLLRLPMYYELQDNEIEYVISRIKRFFKQCR